MTRILIIGLSATSMGAMEPVGKYCDSPTYDYNLKRNIPDVEICTFLQLSVSFCKNKNGIIATI